MTEEEFAIIQRNMAAARGEAVPRSEIDRMLERAVAEEPKPRRGRMNKLETRFRDEVLQRPDGSGRYAWHDFEPMKFRLADGAWYTPDWMAMDDRGAVTAFEVKGFWREAARVRIKVAADKYPFRFVAVTKDRKTGEWQYENFTGRTRI